MVDRCRTCGNNYDKMFTVKTHSGEEYTFDCFECAINLLAPHCQHCNCTMIGHGIEIDGVMYCCANCARHESSSVVRDRNDGDRIPPLGSEGGAGAPLVN